VTQAKRRQLYWWIDNLNLTCHTHCFCLALLLNSQAWDELVLSRILGLQCQ
jgi:hypothetical protein